MVETPEKFTFINGIYPQDPNGGYNKSQRDIIGVVFNIDAALHQTLWTPYFTLMTEDEIVRMVEEYLSEPLTKRYYNSMRNLSDDDYGPTFEQNYAGYGPFPPVRTRGDAIEAFCFLERIVTLSGNSGRRIVYLKTGEEPLEQSEEPP